MDAFDTVITRRFLVRYVGLFTEGVEKLPSPASECETARPESC